MKQLKRFPNIQTLRNLSSMFKSTHRGKDKFFQVLLELAVQTVGARNAAILMVDEKSGALSFYLASGDKSIELKEVDIPPGQGIAGAVVESGEPVVSNDVSTDKRWFSLASEKTNTDVRAIVCQPIFLDDKVIGAVELLDKEDGTKFDDDDVETLGHFANILSMAFGVIRGKDQLKNHFDKLQEEYRQRYTIVGESGVLRQCIYQAQRVSNSKASVLISGESGTGKELFAHLIHDRSPRQSKPFISISCGALPASILERELFGHEKGAFTGADSRKIGLFEAADGGTLFLDEIGEMPLDMQVKLLRVLQEESFLRLGGTQPIQVDVRLISATNRDLDKMVQEGTFRQDLFYRINVINLSLPPLRERPEDIPDLVHYFIRKHNPPGQPKPKLAKGLLSHLKGYSWPGNIRHLENAVERAIVFQDSGELTVDSFPFESSDSQIEINVGASLKEASDAFRKSFITNTLKSTAGNRTKAAKILDVQRSYLSRLIKELEID
ncbi:MAG: GAF domain-containing protein [Candidatus Nitronauta litoralis]|uniref:GAF domain-containing protein n=1 Tax=Candidatus Nitronauta litoralis TaxID=2705533 RepID=A0A7T0BTX1_9BACT|nr:MAG: GAF domain-containing protein [Candidatus Nitronauta litoralis]